MNRIPQNTIDDILLTARIEEVIGEFVQLKRAGSNYKGLSPFTDEKTPSFMVSPAKQIFKCFSTGKGGNVVSFLMELEHFSYPEALKWLANKYGIELPEEKDLTPDELAQINEKESLFIINEFAKNHFFDRLFHSDEGKAIGLSYFHERGFREDIIRKFQLGYCLDSGSDFTETAVAKGYKQDYLEQVGLSKSKDNRRFDFFRGRVMFPILSVSGRVLGFGGRTLKADKNIAKYFNSPESPIYNKSQILYGLFFAKNAMVKQDCCFLVEGYTDVISLHQAGLENVVASSGTSLTKEQIKLVKRYTNNITILYDGDAAGIKASFRGIDLILEEGMNVKVVLFPDGDDPDSYAKKVSPKELETYVEEHAQDFISFKAGILLNESGNDPIKKAKLIREIVQSIAIIPDAIVRSVFIQECAVLFEMEEATLIAELNKIRKTNIQKQHLDTNLENILVQPKAPKLQHRDAEQTVDALLWEMEKDLIRILLKFGAKSMPISNYTNEGKVEEIEVNVLALVAHEMEQDELVFSHPTAQKIYQTLMEGLHHENGAIYYEIPHFLRTEDQEILQFVSNLEISRYSLSANWLSKHKIFTLGEDEKITQAVLGALYTYKLAVVEKQFAAIRQSLKNVTSDEEVTKLLSEQIVLEKVKKMINEKLGRIIVR
jgi:DNA primase